MSKKIIVTGGAGYIGSHVVVELVNAGYEPVIIDNFVNSHRSVIKGITAIIKKKVRVYDGDCCDEKFVRKMFGREKNIAGVIHFAAYKAVGESVDKPLKYYENNVGSLLTVLKVMSDYRVRDMVFSSSCTVYGQPDRLPVTEDTPKKPAACPYGNTKKMCEEILEDVFKSGVSMRTIALRYFNPIGAHPTALIGELPLGIPSNLVPFVTQTAAGIREKLTVFGNDYATADGTCIRDYIHVVDLARAHVKALEYSAKQNAPFYDAVNVGTGCGNTVLEVVKTFEKVTGKPLNYVIGPRRPGDVEKIYASADKAAEVLEWKTELSLEDALRDAWKWQNNLKR